MKIKIAKTAGFCFGVTRALKIAQETQATYKEQVYTYGPIIHNKLVVNSLEEQGIRAIENMDEYEKGNIIIRSHGIGPVTKEKLQQKFNLVDATCPFVKKAHDIVKKNYQDHYQIIIIGQKKHPEVQGLLEYCNGHAIVIEDLDDIAELNGEIERAAVLAQTTQETSFFEDIVAKLKIRIKDLKVINTICLATVERQKETKTLAEEVDLMLIVGGKNSANTNKLYEIAKNGCENSHLIEEAKEIDENWFKKVKHIGITAGASTPDWIIKEVVQMVEQINSNVENGNAAVQIGDIVKGKVIKILEKEVLIDFGGKTEGIIPVAELTFRKITDPNEVVSVDEEIVAKVIKENEDGSIILSKFKAEEELAWDKLMTAFEEQKNVPGKIVEVVKGGLIIDLGIRGFIPASLASRTYVSNLEEFLNQEVEVKIAEIDREKNRVVASRKAVEEEVYQANKAKVFGNLKVGQICKGIVKRLSDFGAFVDIGGVDGLLHVSEISYERISKPEDVLQLGQEVEVKVINIDPAKGNISLSSKQLQESPWVGQVKKYSDGRIVEGKAVKITNFGVFVELEPGVEGLVHISQISNERVKNVADVITPGETYKVKILKIDHAAQKISLSIKEASEEAVLDKEIEKEINKYSQNNETFGVTLGELFGDMFKK